MEKLATQEREGVVFSAGQSLHVWPDWEKLECLMFELRIFVAAIRSYNRNRRTYFSEFFNVWCTNCSGWPENQRVPSGTTAPKIPLWKFTMNHEYVWLCIPMTVIRHQHEKMQVGWQRNSSGRSKGKVGQRTEEWTKVVDQSTLQS